MIYDRKEFIEKLFLFMIVMSFMIVGMVSCQFINDLSRDNNVSDFDIEEIVTTDVIVEVKSIEEKESTIWLTLVYGRHNFPIVIRPAISVAEGARVVENTDTMRFENEESVFVFHVIAANGATKEWQVRLDVLDRPSDANLIDVKVNVSNKEKTFVSNSAVIVPEDSSVLILSPEVSFPLNLTLECVLSDSAKLVGYENGKELVFDSYLTIHDFDVVAADGLRKRWRVVLHPGDRIINNDDVAWSVWRDVSFLPSSTTVSSSIDLYRVDVNADLNRIRGMLDKGVIYPDAVEFKLESNVPEYVESIGYDIGSMYKQENAEDTLVFYLFDRVRLVCKRWTMYVTEWLSDSANIDKVALLQSSPGDVEIDYNHIIVDNKSGWILLPITEGHDNMPLRVKMLITPSEGCKMANEDNVIDLTFESITDVRQMELMAADGSLRMWNIGCTDNVVPETQAKVVSAKVSYYTSQEDRMELDRNVVIDETKGELQINIIDWPSYFPLSIRLDISVSYGASIVDADFVPGEELLFNNIYDEYKFSVLSKDESTSNSYVIKLMDKSIGDHSQADLIKFEVSNESAGYETGRVIIDQDTKNVIIELSSVGKSEFVFVPIIEVSAGATLSGITSGAAFPFGTIDNEHKFEIVSEDGSVVNEWSIKVLYHPQIKNFNLDVWTNSNTPEHWGTANNSFGKNTLQDAHGSGYCAKMSTSKMVGQIAAGSLFLGKFKMDLSQMDDPRKMTYFGEPFTERPLSMSFDYKYQKVGEDKGSAVIELLNFEGDGEIEYHGIGNEAGVTVLYRGYLELDNTVTWKNATVPVKDVNSQGKDVTHIHIVFSSSYKGDVLQGESGATLWVDNIILNYE